ncbi:exportin-1-like, partial [Trifolium medium]|nr:exportin-1-like [Trifolium medium]
VLEGVIKYRWNALPAEQRDGMKNFISDIIVQLSSNEASFRMERLYVNKLNIILVQGEGSTKSLTGGALKFHR